MTKKIGFLILVCCFSLGTIPSYAATEINDNAVWTWWFYPQCVSVGDSICYGYVDNHNNISVALYNPSTKEHTSHILKVADSKKPNKETNDHNSVSVNEMYDGRIMCVYTKGHQTSKSMLVSISDEIGSISSFTTIELKCSGKTGYAQVVKTAGRYYLFYRVSNHKWAYRWSENGTHWTDETILLSHETKCYCLFRPTAEDGIIRIVFNCHKKVKDNNIDMRWSHIRGGFLNTADNLVYGVDDMKSILGASELSYTDFPIIERANGRTRLLDLAANTDLSDWKILYCQIKSSNRMNYYLYNSGKTSLVKKAKKGLCNSYPLGACFNGADNIIVVHDKKEDIVASLRQINAPTTCKEVLAKVSLSSEEKVFRPISNDGITLWLQGQFSDTDYHDYSTKVYTR